MLRFISFFLLFLFFGVKISAQQSLGHRSLIATFQQGVEYYDSHKYQAARPIFEEVNLKTKKPDLKEKSAFYSAVTSIKLNHPNAKAKVEAFIHKYPTSSKINKAYLEFAEHYFNKGNYKQSKVWFAKVNTYNISLYDKEKYLYQYGYSLFKTNSKAKAKTIFQKLQNSKQYGSDAKYYIGYLAYKDNQFEEATSLFEEAQQEGSTRELSYFLSDMNFKSGNFEKAIELGLEKLPKSSINEKSQINKIIGESYFNLQKYDKAIPYLQEYKGEKGKWSNTDYYQLGYAHYMQEDYASAIAEFNKIIDGNDDVAQNAYYHLAQSYIKTNQKPQALNAFKNAMEMSFDKTIKEDSFLNYAKLSYDIGNTYESVTNVLNNFINQYPNSPESNNFKALLIDSYLSSKNYKEAIDLLADSNEVEDKIIWQKANYYYAIEFFKSSAYNKAIIYFDQSISKPVDKNILAEATYWKAESNYILNLYQNALLGYKNFKELPSAQNTAEIFDVDYAIAYTYFKKKDYEKSKSYFVNALDNLKDKDKIFDAYVRLGDSYYVTNDYWSAMKLYNKAIQIPGYNKDYVKYQKAVSYGFVDRNKTKIIELKDYTQNYPNSVYLDDAYYQLGNTYIAEDNTTEGIEAYQKLVKKRPQSPFIPKVLSKIGLAYYNSNQNDKALTNLKQLVSSYPATEEARQAVQTVKLIYIDQQQTDEYAKWVKGLNFVNITETEIDNATYQAAEKKFLDNKVEEAIKGFENYLKKYPNGLHALKSHFYLGQLYYKKEKFIKSIPNYKYVAKAQQSEYLEESLRKLSTIYLEQNALEDAIQTLLQLETKANFTENKVFAQLNLMKSYYEMNNHSNTIKYAQTVLDTNTKLEDKIRSDAYTFIARSFLQQKDIPNAKKSYAQLENFAEGKRMAEALYHKAYFLYLSKDYEKSNNVIQNKLTKDYSKYKEFGLKALIIMAKNYYALEDAFQANYILESIVNNYSEKYPDITEEAKKELATIKAKESETNSSIGK